MKSQATKPALIVKKVESLSLSGPVLLELLRSVLDKGRPFRFRAKGFSMSPFVKNEDVITVSPLLKRSPRLGEVVAYVCAETGKLIVHRVVGKRSNCYLIVGDNTPGKYDLVPEANVLGRITSVKRNDRNVFLGLGPERILIAFLSRRRWLFPLILPVWKLVRPIVRISSL